VKEIECTLTGFGNDLIYTFFDHNKLSHNIAMGNFVTQTGFVSKSTSLVFDRNHPEKVWVAGDFRVRSFDLDEFKSRDLLYVWDSSERSDEIVRKSGLAIWEDFVVLGHNDILTFWKRAEVSIEVPGWSWNDSSLAENAIEKKRGRMRAGFAKMKEGEIDCLAVAGEFLAIASSSGPIIQLVRRLGRRNDFSLEVVCRLIGHTMGITGMVARIGENGPELFSGSKDGTVKVWNVVGQEMKSSLQLRNEERRSEITALHVSEWKDAHHEIPHVFVFSGYFDGMIRVWDFTVKSPIFEIVMVREAQNLVSPTSILRAETMTFGGHQVDDGKERLIPKAIGFRIALLGGTCELQMIGVDDDANGERQCFEFEVDRTKL
jgi:WD40 repeat protein